MIPSGILTMLTDFGTEDAYVAAMKGVVLGRDPNLTLVDISHQIPPQDVDRAAYVLAEAIPWYPTGTVHVVVVDPGVGTVRKAMVVVADGQIVVCPDNGVIGQVLERSRQWRCYSLDRPELGLQHKSHTFHGRDLFSPAGAMIASGQIRPEECGESIEPVWRRRPSVLLGERSIMGTVQTVDHFGNLITDIQSEHLPETWPNGFEVSISGREVDAVVQTYGAAEIGQIVALLGSGGWLEIARVEGNAAVFLDQRIGARVHIRWE